MRAFRIAEIEDEDLEESLNRVKKFPITSNQQITRLMVHAIGTIHKIAGHLHGDDVHGRISLYIGRAGRKSVRSRLEDSSRKRLHVYGTVFARCNTDEVKDAETHAIRLFKLVKKNNGLCIKKFENIAGSGIGSLPDTPDSFLYMTWKVDSYEGDVNRLTPSEIKDIIDEVRENELYENSLGELSRQSLRTILELTRRRSSMVPLRWHRNHR